MGCKPLMAKVTSPNEQNALNITTTIHVPGIIIGDIILCSYTVSVQRELSKLAAPFFANQRK